jgi:hypothetical protein
MSSNQRQNKRKQNQQKGKKLGSLNEQSVNQNTYSSSKETNS